MGNLKRTHIKPLVYRTEKWDNKPVQSERADHLLEAWLPTKA